MRPDMKKVIIERPRAGGVFVRKPPKPKFDVYNIDKYEDVHRQEGMKERLGWDGKEQTDLLGPVQRFLQKSVGRRWDDVWSEICEHNKDVMGSHLKDHIKWMVETDLVRDENGELVDSKGSPMRGWMNFYVNPDNGVLTKGESRSRFKYRPTYTQRIYNIDGQDYYKFDGIWYRVTMVPYVRSKSDFRTINDVFGNGGSERRSTVAGYNGRNHLSERFLNAYGICAYCERKQQANSKECFKLNRMEVEKKAS